MSLQQATSFNSFTWAQQQLNPGFSATYQGPDTFSYSRNYTIDTYGINSVYAVQLELAPSTSTTIDLQNLTDFFNNTMILTRVYGIQISAVDADMQFGPSATNGCQWFFNSLSGGIVIKANSDFSYNTTSAFTVSAGTSCLDIANLSSTSILAVKLALLGGEGPAVSPTPTPTTSPAPTPNPTGTPVPTGTPIPTPSPSSFVTPTFTPSPT